MEFEVYRVSYKPIDIKSTTYKKRNKYGVDIEYININSLQQLIDIMKQTKCDLLIGLAENDPNKQNHEITIVDERLD